MIRLKKKIIFATIMFLAYSSATRLAQAQPTQLTVISTFAPKYPPLAKFSNTQGEVVILVKVNNHGDVISAEAIDGHILLREAAKEAATQWKFSHSIEVVENRETQLIFSFGLKFEESANVQDETGFTFPNRYKYVYKIPTVLPLNSAGSQAEEKDCFLHHEKMKLGLAEITYGLPEMEIGYPKDLIHIWQNLKNKIKRRNSYFDVAQRSFPNSNLWVGGGCVVGYEKKAETLFCQQCRDAESQWRRKHPRKGYGVVAVISGSQN